MFELQSIIADIEDKNGGKSKKFLVFKLMPIDAKVKLWHSVKKKRLASTPSAPPVCARIPSKIAYANESLLA